jgi:hypothetical protein
LTSVENALDAKVFPGCSSIATLKVIDPRRPRSKNSGGRIAPAAIGGPYRGPGLQRQRYPNGREPELRRRMRGFGGLAG